MAIEQNLNEFLNEVLEMIPELLKFNKKGIKEEFQDVMHFIQLWSYWWLGINGDVWGVTRDSVDKFMARKKVWQDIYEYVGLPRNISNQCSNYNMKEKVIKELARFNVSKEKATDAYIKIVKNR